MSGHDFAREEDIRFALKPGARIAVVGLSSKPDRDSHRVAAYLIEQGYEVVPVNPTEAEILGRPSQPDVVSVPGQIDVVDVFRRPDAVGPVVEEAIAAGASAIWLQLGVVNAEAAERARSAGLRVIMDRCMKVEHKRVSGEH